MAHFTHLTGEVAELLDRRGRDLVSAYLPQYQSYLQDLPRVIISGKILALVTQLFQTFGIYYTLLLNVQIRKC